ncbi:MAG: hypothetical protein MK171_12570 [Pirellulales bacterium]|nr:hypothetical protein [Pirellulales bacterium]
MARVVFNLLAGLTISISVSVMGCTGTSMDKTLATGDYVVSYRHAEGAIRILGNGTPADAPALALVPGGGDPRLQFLDPANVTETTAISGKAIVIKGKLDWCTYTVTISVFEGAPNLINSQVAVQTTSDLVPADDQPFEGSYPELSYVNSTGKVLERSAVDLTYYLNGTPGSKTYHTRVPGTGTVYDLNQFVFFGDATALHSSLHYLVDFSSLSDYFTATETRILDSVRQPPGCLEVEEGAAKKPLSFGYDVPGIKVPLPQGTSLTLANSNLYLESGVPAINEPVDYCRRFVTGYSNIYPLLKKPNPKFVDWPDITEKGFADLIKCHEKLGRSQIGIQTNLWSIKRYLEKFPSETGQSLVNHEDRLWNSVRMSLPFGDAWQYLFNYVAAGDYLETFDSEPARKTFLHNADEVVTAGQKLNYIFPLAIDAEFTNGGKWLNEYDCTGAYVFLMMLYHKETGDPLYLDEARKAAQVLSTIGFEYPYEFTTTSLGPIGLLRLYRETGEKQYLDACAIPMAAILRHSWTFNPGYREYKGRNIFLLTEGMPGVYSNGWEEATLLRYLYLFLTEGQDIVPRSTLDLVSELLRWKALNVADSIVPLYTDKSIVYTGKPREFKFPVVNEWHIPIEGFGYLEWDDSGLHDKPGRVSQGPYCFGAVPEAANLLFHPIAGNAVLYVEAPIVLTKQSESSESFKVLGGRSTYRMAISASADSAVRITSNMGENVKFSEAGPDGWSWATVSPNAQYTTSVNSN